MPGGSLAGRAPYHQLARVVHVCGESDIQRTAYPSTFVVNVDGTS